MLINNGTMKITMFLTLTLLSIYARLLNFPKVFPLKGKIELLCNIADRHFGEWRSLLTPKVTGEVGDQE